MERKRIGFISLSLCLALAMLLMPEPAQAQNCDKRPDHPKCGGGGGGGGDSERLTVWFRDDVGGGDNLRSDDAGGVNHLNCDGPGGQFTCYVDGEEKVKAHIDGPPGGIRLELLKSPRGIRLGLLGFSPGDCESAVAGFSCDEILPPELTNFSVVQTWHVTARAYTDDESPQLIPVGESRSYRLRLRVRRIDGRDWIVELGSEPPPHDVSTRCGEEGQSVQVTRTASDKWEVTAVPVKLGTEDELIYNARVCSIKQVGTPVLVARLRMTFQYTAQLK